jgi:hypothetical protein
MRIPITTAAAAVAVTISLAACGSSNPTTNAASQSVNANYTKALAFASCMRLHGVPNFPDPTAGSNGGMRIEQTNGSMKVNGVTVNAPAFQAAQQACRSKLPNGGRPQPLSASRRQAMLNFSACMRSHGEPGFPDPTFNGGAVGIQLSRSSGIDPQSPAFKAAQTACAPVARRAGFGIGGGP